MNAVEFLQWFRPGGPWVLSAIVPDGRITTVTFIAGNEKQMGDWVKSRDGAENIYFQVNSTGDEIMTSKASKEKIIAAEWLHVDIDPKVGEDFDHARRRILKSLQEATPKPNLIIDSGGGYQGFWRLDKPVRTENWSEFERYNRQLEADFGGDHCHNVDRIMRLPGTTNVPNKKKVKAGRKPAPTKVIRSENQTFELSVFAQAPMIDGGDQGDVGRPKVVLSGNLPRLANVDDLNEWGDVSSHVKMLIVQGIDPDRPDKYPSRSEAFWFVICELVRCEIPDDIIASVILDRDFLISGHVLDQKNPQGYAVRQIQRAKEYAINEALPGFNDTHFVAFVGGKVKVVEEKHHEKRGRELIYYAPGDFQSYYSNKVVEIGVTKEGVPVTKKLGKWWYEHQARRSYRGIVFDPEGQAPPDHYNLWRGYSMQAVAGENHLPFLEHLRDNICNGNDEHYQYLIRWVARLVQHPATQSETAIVLRGKEGTGKNTFVNTISRFFPEHFFESSSSNQFLGQFNSHLRDKVLVHANEAFFAGDKKHEATLKMLITEATMPIEAKGIDIIMEPNYTHIIMSSNSDWVVPAGPDSRRFLVLDVSDKYKQHDKYFGRVYNALDAGGRSHLLRYLLDFDLSDFNIRAVPITQALIDQRIKTMPKEAQWWMHILDRGYVINSADEWDDGVESEHVYRNYMDTMKDLSEHWRLSAKPFGMFMSKAVPGLERIRVRAGKNRLYKYQFPPLDDCRAAFDEIYGGPFEWGSMELMGQGEMPF